MHHIIDLTLAKIQSLLEQSKDPDIQDAVEEAIRPLSQDDALLKSIEGGSFRYWIENLPVLTHIDP